MMTRSCTPGAPKSSVTSTFVATTASPSASIRKPLVRIACACSAFFSTKVTDSPASASRAPSMPPIAPAPMMQIRTRYPLFEPVAQRADPVDRDLDRATGLHLPGTDRGSAGDDVAGDQRHVARDQADQPRRLDQHVAGRVVLALLA